MQVTVIDKQSILDISIQYLGSVLCALDIALANDISITAPLTAGQQIIIPESIFKNEQVAQYFKGTGYNIATTSNEQLANNNDVNQYLYPQTLPLL